MEIVNIVATGELNFDELDIEQLHHDLGTDICQLKPGQLDLRFDSETPLIMVYPAGSYTIPGATSFDQLYRVREKFTDYLSEVSNGALSEHSFSVKYMVFMSDFESHIDLQTLAVELGLENVEYEPEQFPGLIYRTEGSNGVILIFSSGKVLFTGFENESDAKEEESQLLVKSKTLES
ncbi:TATA-box-binding protein C [Haloplanus halobius]|uniref:TATA-box-binding protein C n=1 Tax=Haloplanus halobius TaxID=2934938 RepID=UPI00200E340F|nr:TATA-box-binding protein C [Haloplanus sp. XH21]